MRTESWFRTRQERAERTLQERGPTLSAVFQAFREVTNDPISERQPVSSGRLSVFLGETHVHRYLRPLLAVIEQGRLDPSFIVSHRWPLSRAAEAYRMWNDKADDCTKIVLDPAR